MVIRKRNKMPPLVLISEAYLLWMAFFFEFCSLVVCSHVRVSSVCQTERETYRAGGATAQVGEVGVLENPGPLD